MLLIVVAQSSSDGNVIHYAILVLWMTSCLHIMQGKGQN